MVKIKKILIGGSPCTNWSIAQKNNREIEPKGIGWELFKNYLIAKEKFQPDYFLYENNKSAAQPIKSQISFELGVPLQYINSALVSAQNRQRFYAHNISDVSQPKDRGILLKSILEDDKDWIIEPVCMRYERTELAKKLRKKYESGEIHHGFNEHRILSPRSDGKTNTLSTVLKDNTIVIPYAVGVGYRNRREGDGKLYRRFETHGEEKSNALTTVYTDSMVAIPTNKPMYEVKNGLVEIKGRKYPIKLEDGYYIIRKLTINECCRLQTMPDNYCKSVSNSQAYRGLGNGWTAEVIIHILKHMNIPLDEEIIVLSMYDGIGTGRYCFDKMGYKNIKYYSYEIDKYAMKVSNDNYPDIIQCGDAFQLRDDDWSLLK